MRDQGRRTGPGRPDRHRWCRPSASARTGTGTGPTSAAAAAGRTGSTTRTGSAASSPTSPVHQIDQFLWFTGSTTAEVVASTVANYAHPDRPGMQDFGEVLLRSDNAQGYVRVDWYTPAGLPTWGDGRLMVLGTEGYLELRKYVDIEGRDGRQPPVRRRSVRHRVHRLLRRRADLLPGPGPRRPGADHDGLRRRHHTFEVMRLALTAQQQRDRSRRGPMSGARAERTNTDRQRSRDRSGGSRSGNAGQDSEGGRRRLRRDQPPAPRGLRRHRPDRAGRCRRHRQGEGGGRGRALRLEAVRQRDRTAGRPAARPGLGVDPARQPRRGRDRGAPGRPLGPAGEAAGADAGRAGRGRRGRAGQRRLRLRGLPAPARVRAPVRAADLLGPAQLGTPAGRGLRDVVVPAATATSTRSGAAPGSGEGGGPTLGHGIHQIDLLLHLLGPWQTINATAVRLARPVEFEDVSMAIGRSSRAAPWRP